MNADEIITSAVMLLQQITDDPDEAQRHLSDAERTGAIATLSSLGEQAAGIHDAAGLLTLADGILRLIEDTPGLRAWLIAKKSDIASRQLLRSRFIAKETVMREKRRTGEAQPRITQASIGDGDQKSRDLQERLDFILRKMYEVRDGMKQALQDATDADKPRPGAR